MKMENCTIYSYKLEFDKVALIVKNGLRKAKVVVTEDGLHKSLTATIKGGFFGKTKSLKINYRQRKNPSYNLNSIECPLTQNLAGMVNFIGSIESQNEEIKAKFLHKVQSANCEMSFIADPNIDEEFRDVLKEIAFSQDVFIFAQPNTFFTKSDEQHFLDKDFDLILDTKGKCEIYDLDVQTDARFHDPEPKTVEKDQLERRNRSNSFLESKGILVNQHLPVVGGPDSKIRTKDEIVKRAYALLLTAVKGEGMEQEHLERTVFDKKIDFLSPKEKEIFDAESMSDIQKAYATWRYESLQVIIWALGLMENLPYPSDICNVKEVVAKIFTPSREEFENSVNIKTKDEILEALDMTYRMHWACVNARIKNEEVGGQLNPSIIYERHYALNWLTNFEGLNWDNVSTPT